ncbi:MAG: helix-turn-helix transcriptional regulator [Clostridia bacterium]|nr:helix-turn-helix transcriptional regulator [Clostridia bacterium]
MNHSFPQRFSQLLKDSNMTYDEVASALNLKSKGTISKYANGKNKKVDLATVIKISELFNVSPVWLIGLTDNMHYKIKK